MRSAEGVSMEIPAWNLGDLYAGPDDPALAAALDDARRDSEAFHAAYAGRLALLSGEELGTAIARYENIMERLQRVLSYAQLYFAEDMSDPERGRFQQTIQEHYNAITVELLFFTLELNRIDDTVLDSQCSHPLAAKYRPWLRDQRVFRPHQLADDVEAILHEKAVAGRNAWIRLFEQTLARLRCPVDGEDRTLTDLLNMMSHADPARRRDAARALGSGLADQIELLALVTNTLAKDKEIEDRYRRYPTPVSHRNLANRVEDQVVDALVTAIQSAYDALAHRYYRLKARWFGVDALDYWDRNAPLPGGEERTFTWAEARHTVLDAFQRFHPTLAEVASPFFSEGWIDAQPRPGKEPGAFSHPTVPSVHPYILLNYYGRPRDVTTLAHELGHGVHQQLAGRQGALMADTPLTLAETASVFGEMLVFRAVLEGVSDPDQRRRLLAAKVEDMLNTVVRQIAFYEFERLVHEERRNGELSPERLGEIWFEVQRTSLGPAIRFHDEYKYFWSYIPHFIHSPFYVYAYAFGDCLVNALYNVYRTGFDRFEEHYIDMLQAGGTRGHHDLLQPFGLDARDPQFWRGGLDVIVGLIDELEALG
ncbi:MAG: M3 family oligoendopeptidase [Rhodospirillales bacterium]|nr:MAG: M3 family oligoendopeptidase [Rhodospirillales bacterium]